MGTPDLAATVLGALQGGPDEIVGVFSRPDASRGRGLALEAPPVKQLAERHGVPVFQPPGWKDGTALEMLRGLRPDLVVVAAYGRLLPQAALDVPRYGCINVHASLLPRWRGADPITRAILAGDAESGVTIMQMVLEMDAGDMLLERAIPIASDDTGDSLERKLATLGASALVEAIAEWRAGRLAATAQDPAAVTLAPMIRKADGVVDWSRGAVQIERAVRGYIPWPVAATTRAAAQLRLWRAEIADTATGTAAPGTVLAVDARGIVVATGDGALRLLEVQAAGKKRMPAADWARGARLAAGDVLGA
ncbi:MAG: methionyl-tRNA formyltransferase [Deltaproteobacteria bacterium]|nr:methionyl-tRNA formyltransferase [Deltaproteobacteria bacterium]